MSKVKKWADIRSNLSKVKKWADIRSNLSKVKKRADIRSNLNNDTKQAGIRSTLLPDELTFARAATSALARKPAVRYRLMSCAIIAFVVFMIIWAALAEVDEVTHAEGQVVASQRIQTIQNLEGGILSGLLVLEGQIVAQGDVLARLDNEMAASNYRDAISRALDHQAAIIRLQAELENKEPLFPQNAAVWLADLMGAPINAEIEAQANQVFQNQTAAWQARNQRKEAELSLLRSQHEQRLQEVKEQTARLSQAQANLAISKEQMALAEPLVKSGNYSRMDFLRLQSQAVALTGEIHTIEASLPRARAAAAEVEQRMAFREAELAAGITDEMNQRRLDLASIRETISAGGDRVTRTELRSPVRGAVRQVFINTVGGVVKPGEAIMDIVPLDGTLLVEARVRPSDVAFLRPRQSAMVKISAYDFSIYGGLQGQLEQISADTIEDKRGESFYQVRVRTDSSFIVYQGNALSIMPGMLATVDIMIGKKTVLDYILKPVLKSKQNALRER